MSTPENPSSPQVDEKRWQRKRLPEWLRMPLSKGARSRDTADSLESRSLNTICEEARCPKDRKSVV